jgi:hypothetical protein
MAVLLFLAVRSRFEQEAVAKRDTTSRRGATLVFGQPWRHAGIRLGVAQGEVDESS